MRGKRTSKGTRRMVVSGLENLAMEEVELEHGSDGSRRESTDDRAVNNRNSELSGIAQMREDLPGINKALGWIPSTA